MSPKLDQRALVSGVGVGVDLVVDILDVGNVGVEGLNLSLLLVDELLLGEVGADVVGGGHVSDLGVDVGVLSMLGIRAGVVHWLFVVVRSVVGWVAVVDNVGLDNVALRLVVHWLGVASE